jgi:hypothetical protein
MSDPLKRLASLPYEVIVFIGGFVFLLLGAVEQSPTPANWWALKVVDTPHTWALVTGGVLILSSVGLFILDRRYRGANSKPKTEGPGRKETKPAGQLEEFSELIGKTLSPEQAPNDLRKKAAEELRAQREQIEKQAADLRRERDHQLVRLVEESHLDSQLPDYDQRIDDRFLAIGATSKAIVKTLYKHSPEKEVSSDKLYDRHNAQDPKHPVPSESEMYHRVMMLAFLSLVDVKAVGPRNTVVKKVPDVHRVLTHRKRLDS